MVRKNLQKIIKNDGVTVWNQWGKEHPSAYLDMKEANFSEVKLIEANLSGVELINVDFTSADLSDADLSSANLSGANLTGANLTGADLFRSNFTEADLSLANMVTANLQKAVLTKAKLKRTNLKRADLRETLLSEAELIETNLQYSILVEVNINNATLIGCEIFGFSAWEMKGIPKVQTSLIITPTGAAEITVDDLQVAQFIYLLLNNQNVRNVIDTITSKAVLILGRFTKERKAILDALHEELRKRNYLPILFDFAGPRSRDITETVSTLAHMARFVIADLTDAKSIPQELERVVPDLPSVPVQPILLSSQKEYGMFGHYKRYPWVLETYYYNDLSDVINSISEKIIEPLELKLVEQKTTIN